MKKFTNYLESASVVKLYNKLISETESAFNLLKINLILDEKRESFNQIEKLVGLCLYMENERLNSSLKLLKSTIEVKREDCFVALKKTYASWLDVRLELELEIFNYVEIQKTQKFSLS